jgi:hypothetical protein
MRSTFVCWQLLFLMVCNAIPTLANHGAAGVQLGNVKVPREKFIVFLMIGHCNMMGQARFPENSMHPRAWQFDLNQRPPRWVPAGSRNNVNHLGTPTLPFLQAMATAYPDYHFGVINNASSAAYVQSNYRRGRSNYMQIIGAAQRLRPYVTLGGVLTMLGYMEAENANRTRSFGDQFVAMMQEMRIDLEEPELPFFITQFEIGASKKGRGWMAIANTIDQIPQHVPNTAVISTANFIYDSDHHPSYQSFKLWGMRAAHAVNALSAPKWSAPVADAATKEQETIEAALPKSQSLSIIQSQQAEPIHTESTRIQPTQTRPIQSAPRPIAAPRSTLERAANEAAKSMVSAPPHIVAEVEAVLVQASNTPDPRQILPYKEALTSAYFDIKQVLKGNLDSRRVLVMQMVIEKGQLLPAAKLKVGTTYRLKLGTWSSVPHYHTYPMFDDIMDFESPIFFAYSAEPVSS